MKSKHYKFELAAHKDAILEGQQKYKKTYSF